MNVYLFTVRGTDTLSRERTLSNCFASLLEKVVCKMEELDHLGAHSFRKVNGLPKSKHEVTKKLSVSSNMAEIELGASLAEIKEITDIRHDRVTMHCPITKTYLYKFAPPPPPKPYFT